jgi:hypothetical protein
MARRPPRLPVGGGDAIVLREGKRFLLGAMTAGIVILVLGAVVADQAQPTTSGKIEAVVFFAVFVAAIVFGITRVLRSRSRLEISTERIRYVSSRDNTLDLDRSEGTNLRLVNVGKSSEPSYRLTNGIEQVRLPVDGYSRMRLRQACAARGWELPETGAQAAARLERQGPTG